MIFSSFSRFAAPAAAVALAALCGCASVRAAETLVATLPGDLSVDNKGSANYSIPLSLPPGSAGMAPKLSLNYSSGGGNGPLGVGFSLSTGFPQSITRGRTILARDGVTRGVNFDDTNPNLSLRDKFYLDGKRLICVAGNYGQPGSTYRTEVDSFVTITTNATGATIETFVVTDKSGTKMTFGKLDGATDGFQVGMLVSGSTVTADTLAYTWALKRVEDALGNFCALLYDSTRAATGEYVLSSIRYAGRAGVAAPTEIACTYGTRTDETISYVAGRRFKQSGRLDRIEVSTTNAAGTPTTIARYELAYETGSDFGRNRLLSISPSFGIGGALTAVPASSFTWSNGSAQLAPCTLTLPAQNDDYPDLYGNARYAQGDFDGDGRVDQVSSVTGGLQVSLANGSGFTLVQWMNGENLPTPAHPMDIGLGSMLVLDLNGDGRSDLLITDATCKNIYAVLSTGSGFTGLNGEATPTWISNTDTALKDPGLQGGFVFRIRDQGAASTRIVTGDFTGDGRDDFLVHGYNGFLYLFKSTGTGFAPCEASSEMLGTPCSIDPVFLWGLRLMGGEIQRTYTIFPMPMDINGDGIVDYIWIERANLGSEGNTAGYSKSLRGVVSLPGGGFKKFGIRDHYAVSGGNNMTREDAMFAVFPGDFNGDGLRDLLLCTNGKNSGDSVSRWLLKLNNGPSADGTPQWLDIWGAIPNSVVVGGSTLPTIYSSITAAGWANIGLNRPITSTTDSRYLGAFITITSTAGTGMVASDLNGDGLPDLAWYVYECAIADRGWYVIYSDGKGRFSNPTKLPTAGTLWATLSPTPADAGSNGIFSDYNLSDMGDVDGDGLSELSVKYTCVGRAQTGVTKISRNGGAFGDLVSSVTDGLLRKSEIFYKAAKHDSVYTPGAAVTYPIRELRASTPVVSDVKKDTGSTTLTDRAHFSYQYSGNRLDLSGRGSLGFHSFVTLDRQTSLFKYQFLAQSFPMTGLTAREQTYRYWPDATNVKFRLVNSHDNTVVFDEVVKSASDATPWGTVYPFISQAIEYRWEDSDVAHFTYAGAGSPESKPELLFSERRPGVGALGSNTNAGEKPHIIVSAKSWFDNQDLGKDPQTTIPQPVAGTASAKAPSYKVGDRSTDWSYDGTGVNSVVGSTDYAAVHALVFPRKISYGNLTQLKTDFGEGFKETVTTSYKPVTATNSLSGLVEKIVTAVVAPGYGTDLAPEYAPDKLYTYWGSTPLVETEVIDANRNGSFSTVDQLDLKTTYTRDTLGRVTTTGITGYYNPGTEGTNVLGTLADDNDKARHVGSFTTSDSSQAGDFDEKWDLPKKARNAYGHLTTTEYHPFLGLPETITDANNTKVTITYDALGRRVKVVDGNTDLETETAYEWCSATASDWKKEQPVTPPANHTGAGTGVTGVSAIEATSVYAVQTTATVQPAVTAYFDRLGRTIRTIKEGFGTGQQTFTDTVYNTLGQTIATSLPYASGSTPLWTLTTYDALGRVVTVKAPNGTVTTNTYAGRTTTVTVDAPDLGGVDPLPQSNATLVDAKGRTIKVWNAHPTEGTANTAGDASIQYVLDGFGRMRETILKDQSQKITAEYDALGRQTELNDPDKGLWTYRNNALGQVVRQQDAKGTITRSTFDRFGRPLGRKTCDVAGPVEDAGWYYYDRSTNETLHTVRHVVGASPQEWDRGWIGALQREVCNLGYAEGYYDYGTASIRYYDSKGRPLITLKQIDRKYFYTYSEYDDYSRPKSTRYYWRPAGQEDVVPSTSNTPYYWNDWGYTYTYDGSGTSSKSYLIKIQDSASTPRTWWEADPNSGYDYLDRPVKVRKGDGHWTSRTYRETDGLLTAIRTGSTSNPTAIQNLSFDYDGLGNLTQRTDRSTENMRYDSLNRLVSSGIGGADYAENGNILLKVNGAADFTGSIGSCTYAGPQPHAMTSANSGPIRVKMDYDANGNLLTRVRWNRYIVQDSVAITWAGFDKPRWITMRHGSGRPITASDFFYGGAYHPVPMLPAFNPLIDGPIDGSEFIYDANHSRVVHLEFKTLSSAAPLQYVRKRTYGMGAGMEADYKNQDSTGLSTVWGLDKVRIYVPGPDGVIGAMEFNPGASFDKAETSLVYHYDHLGSIERITPYGSTSTTAYTLDGAGKPSRYSYDAWGQRRNADTWSGKPTTTADGGSDDATPRGFTGHEMLDDLGLVHMNGRIYDALLGRFLSADLVVQNPANWQFFNRYSYVQNNPLTRVDPTGYFSGGSVNCMSPQPTATGLQAMGYTSDRAALFVDFNRGIEAAAGEVFASFIPGVGQYQDLQQYREGNMSNRAAMLMLFMEYFDTQSGGFMPNAGGVRRGVRRAEEGAEALERNLSRLRRAEVDTKHLSEIENLAKNSDEFKRLQFDPAVGKNRPGEALAALETQGKLGTMERAPAGSRADFVVTSGANKGSSVDLMFTPNSTTEVSKMNEHFAKNWDKTASSITEHMGKADFVVMDFRNLTTENRVQVLTYLKDNFSEDQLKKVKILLSAK